MRPSVGSFARCLGWEAVGRGVPFPGNGHGPDRVGGLGRVFSWSPSSHELFEPKPVRTRRTKCGRITAEGPSSFLGLDILFLGCANFQLASTAPSAKVCVI